MKTQQCCVLTGALATTLLGSALVAVNWLLIDGDVVLRNLEPRFSPWIFWVGVFVCTFGLLGSIGSCLSSRPALAIYGICDLVLGIIGLVLGGVLMFTANMHAADIRQSCTLFRQTGLSSLPLGKQYQASYDSMKQALQNCRRNGRAAALGLQDCGRLGRDLNGHWFQEDSQRELLSWTELVSGCGGFCAGDIPLFSFPAPGGKAIDQASKLKSRSPCYKALAGELQARGSLKGAFIVVLSLPLVVASFCPAWIIFHPPPRARKDYLHPSEIDQLESDRLLSHAVSSPDNSGSDDEYYHQ